MIAVRAKKNAAIRRNGRDIHRPHLNSDAYAPMFFAQAAYTHKTFPRKRPSNKCVPFSLKWGRIYFFKDHQRALQGLMRSTAVCSKSGVFRVARTKPRLLAIAAICPSSTLIGRPMPRRWVINSPYACAADSSKSMIRCAKPRRMNCSKRSVSGCLRYPSAKQ